MSSDHNEKLEIPTANQCFADITELQKVNDVIHVGNLLFVRNHGRLSKNGRKDKRFSDCGRFLMYVQLLTITRRSLEADTLRPSVNENGSVDLTGVFPLCQNIQQPLVVRNVIKEDLL